MKCSMRRGRGREREREREREAIDVRWQIIRKSWKDRGKEKSYLCK